MLCFNCSKLSLKSANRICNKCNLQIYDNLSVICSKCSSQDNVCGICLKKQVFHTLGKGCKTCGKQGI